MCSSETSQLVLSGNKAVLMMRTIAQNKMYSVIT